VRRVPLRFAIRARAMRYARPNIAHSCAVLARCATLLCHVLCVVQVCDSAIFAAVFREKCNGHNHIHAHTHTRPHTQMSDDVETFQPETQLLGASPVAFVDAGDHCLQPTTLALLSRAWVHALLSVSCQFQFLAKKTRCTLVSMTRSLSNNHPSSTTCVTFTYLLI
jgi:hypothetical protein